MHHWPEQAVGLIESLRQAFNPGEQIDAWASPTVLDVLKHNRSLTIDELFNQNPAFGYLGTQQ